MHELIETLKNMMNGDAISDMEAFEVFVKDFIEYMQDMYDWNANEVNEEVRNCVDYILYRIG